MQFAADAQKSSADTELAGTPYLRLLKTKYFRLHFPMSSTVLVMVSALEPLLRKQARLCLQEMILLFLS